MKMNINNNNNWSRIILIAFQCHLIIWIIISTQLSTCSILFDADKLHKTVSFTSASTLVDQKTKLFPNSPIIYFKLKPNSLMPSSSSSTSTFFHDITSVRRPNSNIYKLPLKFISNGKPVEIIHSINNHIPYFNNKKKPPYKSILNMVKYNKNSNIFYLPTKFISNAKPIKPFFLTPEHLTSINNNNGHSLNYLF